MLLLLHGVQDSGRHTPPPFGETIECALGEARRLLLAKQPACKPAIVCCESTLLRATLIMDRRQNQSQIRNNYSEYFFGILFPVSWLNNLYYLSDTARTFCRPETEANGIPPWPQV